MSRAGVGASLSPCAIGRGRDAAAMRTSRPIGRGAGGVVHPAELDIASLYRRYGAMVRGRCRLLLGDDAEAQDACQDIFLKLHRYRDGFRGEAQPTTYLYKVTTTTCLNRLRSRKRRREDPIEELPEPRRDPAGSSASPLREAEVRQLVDRLLADQDEGVMACAVYHFVDGMTHAEVGDLLGISAAAVRKRLSKLRSSLRQDPPAWWVEEAP